MDPQGAQVGAIGFPGAHPVCRNSPRPRWRRPVIAPASIAPPVDNER
jgi:hypothetical protein